MNEINERPEYYSIKKMLIFTDNEDNNKERTITTVAATKKMRRRGERRVEEVTEVEVEVEARKREFTRLWRRRLPGCQSTPVSSRLVSHFSLYSFSLLCLCVSFTIHLVVVSCLSAPNLAPSLHHISPIHFLLGFLCFLPSLCCISCAP